MRLAHKLSNRLCTDVLAGVFLLRHLHRSFVSEGEFRLRDRFPLGYWKALVFLATFLRRQEWSRHSQDQASTSSPRGTSYPDPGIEEQEIPWEQTVSELGNPTLEESERETRDQRHTQLGRAWVEWLLGESRGAALLVRWSVLLSSQVHSSAEERTADP